MRAAHIRRITREGFRHVESPLGFLRAGMRPAESCFGLLHPRGTYRLRVGARVTALDGREHDTPTGRCSSGAWTRLDSWDTPATPGQWGIVLSQVWGVILGEGTLSPTAFEGVVGYARGDASRCRTRTGFDAPEPTMGSGCGGKGRIVRDIPGYAIGYYYPASGKRVATHSAGRIKAAVKRQRAAEASREYRETRGDRG